MIVSSFIKYLSFLFLMHGEVRGESLQGQYYVAQVVFERQMDILDTKQFNCFSHNDIFKFNSAMKENSIDKKYSTIILTNLKNKLTLQQWFVWTMLYVNQDIIYLSNFDNTMYYMTNHAFEIVKVKYHKWVKNNLEKVRVIGNHIFLKDKEI